MNIFITGGTSGIGLSLVRHYSFLGHNVATSSFESSEKIQNLLPQNVKYFQVDVTNAVKMNEAIKSYAIQSGSLDLVIANAGINHPKSKLPNFEMGKKVIEVNVIGVLNTLGPAIEIMKDQKSGHIVGISSLSGMYGLPGMAFYGASKAAILNMFETFAIDLPKFGIDVTCIVPGFINTPLVQDNKHKMPFIMTTDKAKKKILSAIENKKIILCFPFPLNIVAYFLKILPRTLYRNIMNLDLLSLTK